MTTPDFWLLECDTFWHHLGIDRVACFVIEGPANLIEGYGVEQWLVRVDPWVADAGVATDLVLVDVHEPDRVDGGDWTRGCTGVYSLSPLAARHGGRFRIQDTVGGHKMTATNCPDRQWSGWLDL